MTEAGVAVERALVRAGVAAGERVAAVVRDPSLELTLLDVLPRLGIGFFPLDPDLPQTAVDVLLQRAGVRWVIRDGPLLDRHRGRFVGRDDGPRLLLATSGTEGGPRVLAFTRARLDASAAAVSRALGFTAADRWLLCLPLHHVAGVQVVNRCRLVGARLETALPFRAAEVLERIAAGAVTHLSLVPTQLWRLLEADPAFRPPSDLRAVLLGGGAAPPDLVARAVAAGWPLWLGYGLTEAGATVALERAEADHPPGRVGRPLPHLSVVVRSRRIHLGGESLAEGWVTAQGVLPLAADDGLYATGDLGRMDERGRLWVEGRVDDLIVSGGVKVRPEVVEGMLMRCPGVREVAVIGRPDPEWGARVVACYAGEWPEARVAAWVRERLCGAHRPAEYRRLAALPRNAMGKIVRRALRDVFQFPSGP